MNLPNMKLESGEDSRDAISRLLHSIREKGVTLWSEEGKLRYRAPKGALGPSEIERLRGSRDAIIELLAGLSGIDAAEPVLETLPRLGRAPLTFSQLAHLDYFRFLGDRYEGRSMRVVWSAMRLCGRLDLDLLRTSLAEIVRRHGALRTLIVDCDGTPMQEISGHVDSDIEFHDLKSVPERSREVEVERHIEQFVQKPVDIAVGPLFGVCLLRTADDEHVLIAAMEHLISDGTSLNIFVRDLLVAYAQLWKGGPVSLPPLSMQFADYAVWQRKSEKLWLDRFHFWKGQFADFRRTRFPQDGSSQTSPSGWATASFRIDAEKRIELLEWSQKMNTTVVLAVFTAYVALVLRWCSVTRSVIQFQFNGRTSKKLENTIGFFASPLHLDVILREEDTFTDLLIRVTDEYCRAHERADSFYLATQVPRPEVTANTVFNWSPLGASIEISGTDGAQGPLACSPIRIPDDPVCKKLAHDHEPVTRFCDAGDEILGSVFFPLHRFSTALIERFTGNLLMFVSALMRQPNQRVNNIKLL